MRHPWYIWIAFGLALAVALLGMGWVTLTALRLDRAEAAAGRRASLEQNVRLALWRMDSNMAPLIAQENARPYFAYSAFYPAEGAYTRMFREIQRGEVLMPSPLLTGASDYVLLHFQFAPSGEVTSPQVPTGNMRDLAEYNYKKLQMHDKIEAAEARLADLVARVGRQTLLSSVPEGAHEQTVPAQRPPEAQQPAAQGEQASQQELNAAEWQARIRTYQQTAVQQKPEPSPAKSVAVKEGVLTPAWAGDLLVLARRVAVNGQDYVQGCWLDWPAIRKWLVEDVRDLLPDARLEPVWSGSDNDKEARMLATLPVRLLPGDLPADPVRIASPIRLSLLIAWGCVLLGAGAVALLLVGAVKLSERRGAFVSAVTHELRTPITTLQMYSEMLAEGMVPEEAQRTRYLATLRAEADRLGHLIENVLVYARLERGRGRRHVESLPLPDLLERVRERLAQRARRAGMTLVAIPPPSRGAAGQDGDGLVVRADVSAVEQILLNLVDNACKYAASAADKRIHLEADGAGGIGLLRVRDHGPGIAEAESRRLFRPFSKSARDAANSAPGVGLGLALSRRLARDMGGDLRLDGEAQGGACFVLSLPAA